MAKWQSTAGPRQTKQANEALSHLSRLQNTYTERTGVVGGAEHSTTFWSPFGTKIVNESYAKAWNDLGERFGWTVTVDNYKAVIEGAAAAEKLVEIPVIDNRRMPDEEAERIKVAEEAQKQQEELGKIETAKRAETRARLLEDFAYLQRLTQDCGMSRWALAAKNIKTELARHWPGVRFTVKSESYSMGDSVHVSWYDGPTTDEIQPYLEPYQMCDFDGMQDLETNRDEVFPTLFGGAHYVQHDRHMSKETERALDAWAKDLFAKHPPDKPPFGTCGPENLIWRLVSKTSMPAGATVTGVERIEGVQAGSGPADFYRVTFTLPQPGPKYMQPCEGQRPADLGGMTISENTEKNGIEIRFPSKPDAGILNRLKAAGWRWSRFGSCWYTKASDEARQFAQSLAS